MKEPTATPLRFREVLVALDGSDLAAAALPTARAAAARFGAKLSTISVAVDQREAAVLGARVRDSLGAQANDVESLVIVDPDPAATIIRIAEDRDALVVMSTRGRGRVTAIFLGSVARDVVTASAAPVLVVGPNADRPGKLVGRPRRRPDSWPEPLSAGSVVAFVDGTATSESVLPAAAAWAEALGVDLVVLTVAEDAPSRPSGTTPNRFGPDNPQQYVDDLAATLRREHPRALRVVGRVTFDPIGPASGLARYLSDHPTALVAVTAPNPTHRGWPGRLSTAAQIVRSSTVPTLVARAARVDSVDDAIVERRAGRHDRQLVILGAAPGSDVA